MSIHAQLAYLTGAAFWKEENGGLIFGVREFYVIIDFLSCDPPGSWNFTPNAITTALFSISIGMAVYNATTFLSAIEAK